ncbi:hypothetical protein FRC17_000569, partial [Serendipita sp. 399]
MFKTAVYLRPREFPPSVRYVFMPTADMEFLILKNITLESSCQPGHFLEDIGLLILELNVDGEAVDKVNLLSRKAVTGTWDADEVLILWVFQQRGHTRELIVNWYRRHEISKEFALSVFLEVGTDDRQLLGSMELWGPNLLDKLEEIIGEYNVSIEIPLMGDENIVLKTKVEAISIEHIEQLLNQSKNQTEINNHFTNAVDQYETFKQTGNLDSLEQAISEFQLVAGMVSEDKPNRLAILNNLGLCLLQRFKQLGNVEDLEKAIAQMEAVLILTPYGHPDKPSLLSNLGISLLTRFERLGNLEDIDNAIARHQAATILTPDGHPDKPSLLSNLGNSLRTRFSRLGNLEDIDNAIARHQAATILTPDGHPDKP